MVRLTDRPDMTLDVYLGRKTTIQQQQRLLKHESQHALVNNIDHRNYLMKMLFLPYILFLKSIWEENL